MKNNCKRYAEDPYICDDGGNPKGQCAHCGDKWYNHHPTALPWNERIDALKISNYQNQRNDKPSLAHYAEWWFKLFWLASIAVIVWLLAQMFSNKN